MGNIHEYWRRVRSQETALPEPKEGKKDVHYIVSLDVPDKHIKPGQVSAVSRRLAAKFIVDGTHKLATAQQTKQYIDSLEDAGRKITADENKRKSIIVMQQSPEPVISAPQKSE